MELSSLGMRVLRDESSIIPLLDVCDEFSFVYGNNQRMLLYIFCLRLNLGEGHRLYDADGPDDDDRPVNPISMTYHPACQPVVF